MKKIVYAGINVIKAAYFIIIIVLLSLFIIAGFLIPNTKAYLVGNQYLKKSEANYQTVNEKYTHTKEELDHITVQNQNLIAALERHFEPNSFLSRYRSIFKDVRIENTNEKYKEGEFSIQEYKMYISVDQPKAFYFFLDSLKKDPNLIKVKDDIILQRTETGVDIELYLKIYNK